jgi:MoaA/NifB/PqqE/SkfB family radical SAM enzyme
MRNLIENIENRLIRKIFHHGHFKTPEFRLIVSITTRCNFNCPGCLRKDIDDNKKIKQDLQLSEFENFLKEGKKIGASIVSFTGGEAILHPDFEKMVGMTQKYGYSYTIVSNGWISKRYLDIIDKYRKNFLHISISLDGATADVHDAVRNIPGSFDRAVQSIKFYGKHKVKTSVSVCLSKKNIEQMEEMMRVCVKNKVHSVKWIGYIPMAKDDRDALSYQERSDAMKKIAYFRSKFGNKCSIGFAANLLPNSGSYNEMKRGGAIDYCRVLSGNSLFLNHEGKMVFCCDCIKDLKNAPSLEKDGFEKSCKITLDAMNNLKKKRLEKILAKEDNEEGLCIFCNNYAEECLEEALKNYN